MLRHINTKLCCPLLVWDHKLNQWSRSKKKCSYSFAQQGQVCNSHLRKQLFTLLKSWRYNDDIGKSESPLQAPSCCCSLCCVQWPGQGGGGADPGLGYKTGSPAAGELSHWHCSTHPAASSNHVEVQSKTKQRIISIKLECTVQIILCYTHWGLQYQ